MRAADVGQSIGVDDRCQPVELVELAVVGPPRGALAQPVPREQLDLVHGGQVEEQVAEHEPQAVHVEDAELLRVSPAGPAKPPGLAPRQELTARLVGVIEVEVQCLPGRSVDLGVVAHPPAVPPLGDPMVDPSGSEVSGEAGPGAGRDPMEAEERHVQDGEVAAHADHAVRRLAPDSQGFRAELEDAADHLVDRPNVLVGQPFGRELEAHGGRPVPVDQHALDSLGQLVRIGAERFEGPAMAGKVDGGHGRRSPVEGERVRVRGHAVTIRSNH